MRTKRRAPCLVCAVALGAMAAAAAAQHSHDALARPRAKAKTENQRVLLKLTGGEPAIEAALNKALADYRGLGKLVRYEYQVAALPAASLAGSTLRKRLGLADRALPTLAVLDGDRVLGALDGDAMGADGELAPEPLRAMLERHKCAPVDAREVLAAGLAEAKRGKRHAFVYLSAPW